MADITAGKSTTENGKYKMDTWFGLLDENQKCVYCHCDVRHHGAEALMVSHASRTNRKRVGVRFMNCHKCAKEKGTEQVMCYQMAESYLDWLIEYGYTF